MSGGFWLLFVGSEWYGCFSVVWLVGWVFEWRGRSNLLSGLLFWFLSMSGESSGYGCGGRGVKFGGL